MAPAIWIVRVVMAAAIAVSAIGGATAGPMYGRGTWESTLQARDVNGDGTADAYFDTSLNITWLANTNLANVETFGVLGVDITGAMTWNTSRAWLSAMNSAGYLGVSGWRFPSLAPNDGVAFKFYSSADYWTGARDVSFNVTGKNSELANLYYVTLGNLGTYRVDGSTNDASLVGPLNTGPFTYTGSWPHGFFIGNELTNGSAWVFQTWTGGQYHGYNPDAYNHSFRAMAVLDGDVFAVGEVGEPALLSLALLGLAALAVTRRHPPRPAGSAGGSAR